jgi:hypothetical protein
VIFFIFITLQIPLIEFKVLETFIKTQEDSNGVGIFTLILLFLSFIVIPVILGRTVRIKIIDDKLLLYQKISLIILVLFIGFFSYFVVFSLNVNFDIHRKYNVDNLRVFILLLMPSVFYIGSLTYKSKVRID